MEATYHVEVLTPERVVLEADVVSLQAHGTEGHFGVLAHHAPFIATLAAGPLTLRYPDGRLVTLQLSGGLFEVAQNRAIVLADGVVSGDGSG